jgi:prevent-host-death family protein
MRNVHVTDAKAHLSTILEAAERGEPTTITRHGKPAAVIVPVDAAKKLYPIAERNFGEFLLSFPGGPDDFARDETPLRPVDF